MVDFKFYLNRQGAPGIKGDKGDKGEKGNTPTFSTGLNTPTVYTMIIDCGDGNRFETGNLKYPMRDDSGSVLKYDRENSTVAIGKINSDDITPGTLGDGTITITQGGVVKGTFTTNQLSNQTIALDAGGGSGGGTAGNGITINSGVISAKIDNDTVTFDSNGQICFNVEPIEEVLDAILGDSE